MLQRVKGLLPQAEASTRKAASALGIEMKNPPERSGGFRIYDHSSERVHVGRNRNARADMGDIDLVATRTIGREPEFACTGIEH
jgi:hypothetical protein